MSVLPIDRVRELLGSGKTDSEIGADLGVSKHSVRRFRGKYSLASAGPPGFNRPPRAISSVRDFPVRETCAPTKGPLEYPARPFAVNIPPLAETWTPEGIRRAVIIPDTHVPYQDHKAVEVTNRLLADFDPHAVCHIGDILDAGKLSMKFPTDPARIDTLQDDIDTTKALLHQWAQITPHARRWLLEGNHEQRLTRLVWGLEGPHRELAKLRDFQETMTWPHLLRLADCGWEWVAYDDQPRADILPHLLVKHGSFVAQGAGMTARREWTKYGKSGASGHTHRAAIWRHRDFNGQATWIEAGCICDLERTPPGGSPDWQQAVTLIEWSGDGALMNVEQVLIRDGRAVWRGKELAA